MASILAIFVVGFIFRAGPATLNAPGVVRSGEVRYNVAARYYEKKR